MPRVKLFDEEEVLTKAIDLFWKQGYSATSIRDLVSHLGINRASLYDTYGDKEELFNKAITHYKKTNNLIIQRFLESEPHIKSGFKKLFGTAIKECNLDKDRKGCFMVNTTTEMVPGDERILDLLSENNRFFKTLFLEYLQKGENEGQFKKGKDLQSIALLLFTLYNGLRVISKVESDQTESIDSINIVLSLLD